MNKKNALRSLLQERELTKVSDILANSASNGRTKKIEHLKDTECESLLKELQEITPSFLIEGIYKICLTIRIIDTEEKCLTNDLLIIEHCLETLDDSHIPQLKSNIRLEEMPYASLYMIAHDLGQNYLKATSKLN